MLSTAQRATRRTSIFVALVLAVFALGSFANYEYTRKQEYEIYSVVLSRLLSAHPAKVVVLWDQTSVGPISRYPIWNDLQATLRYNDEHPSQYDDIPMIRGMEKTTSEAWDDFKKRNTEITTINASRLRLPVPITVILPNSSNQMTKNPWRDFYRKYPGSWGWTELSRIGFDRKANQAVVLVGATCGGLCGGGNLFLLTKSQGEWKVVGEYPCWVS